MAFFWILRESRSERLKKRKWCAMSFSVTNNSVLRGFYEDYRDYAKKSGRSEASEETLDYADSKALKKAIKSFQSVEFNDTKDVTDTMGPVKDFAKKMKAFVDTYNYTVDSSGKKNNSDLKKIQKKMKNFVDQYKDQLDEIGISIGDDGYLKISESSDITTTKRYEDVFGQDSEFLSGLNKLAGNMLRHIDLKG